MGPDGDALRSDELLAQLGWVRALAQRLVSDADVTDEVLQQVCLLALQRTPPDARTGPRLRAWLATATRRLAQHAGRASARRQRRERAAARPEALPSTIDLAVQREALHSLVDAMTGLEESAYSLLVARYFEGRSVDEIAAQSGISTDAVHQRLSRGRRQLRARLQQLLDDDRSGRLRALLPLAPLTSAIESAGSVPTLGHLGGLLVAKTVGSGFAKVVIGLVVLCCVIGGTWYAMGDSSRATADGRPGSPPVSSAQAGAGESPLPTPGLAPAEALVAEGGPASVESPSAENGPPSFSFRGRVVDDAGRPLSGATVVYWPNEVTMPSYGLEDTLWPTVAELPEFPHALTGADGRFVVKGRFVAGLGVTGTNDDPAIVAMADGYANRTHRCKLYSGGDYDAGDIALEPGGWLEGRIADGRGQPIAGAMIKLWNPLTKSVQGIASDDEDYSSLSGVFAATLSGADGRFRSGDLWEGRVRVGFSAEGFLDRYLDDYVPITVGQATDLGEILLDSGSGLVGVVHDESGIPVAGARVLALPSTDMSARMSKGDPDPVVRLMYDSREDQGVRTDEHGRFSIEALGAINYGLLVDAADFEPVRVDDLLPGRGELAVTLGRPATLHLLVVDAETGEPVGGAQVEALRSASEKKNSWLQSIPLRTEPGALPGEVIVSRLGWARTQVTVTAPGHAPSIFDLHGATPPELVSRTVALAREAVVQGRVLGSEGSAVTGAEVMLLPQDAWRAKKRVVQPDESGNYKLPGLGPGEWTLVADAPGRAPVPMVVTLGDGESQSNADFALPLAASVFGTCFGSDGTPEAGVEKDFQRRDKDGVPPKSYSVRSDSSGRYELRDMPLGRWLVGDNPSFEFELHAGERLQLDLRKNPDAEVSGRVLHADGRPAAGAWVFASRVRASGRTTHVVRSDEYGNWTWKPALPGRLDFLGMVMGGGGSSSVVSLDLQKGEQRTIDVVLGDCRVTGLVTEETDGGPVAAARVRLLPVSSEGEPLAWGGFDNGAETFEFGVLTDAAGRFEFRDVAPGRYRAELSADGHATTEQSPFDVSAGAPTELVLRVQRTGQIHGRANLANGVPVAERSLLLAEHDRDRQSAVIASGQYELNGLLPGVWRLSVTDGEKVIAERTITLEPGQDLEVDLVAPP